MEKTLSEMSGSQETYWRRGRLQIKYWLRKSLAFMFKLAVFVIMLNFPRGFWMMTAVMAVHEFRAPTKWRLLQARHLLMLIAPLYRVRQFERWLTGGKGLVWWLIGLQSTPKRQFLAAAGFLAVFSLGLGSALGAFLMLISMYLHEFGHSLVFKLTKIKHWVLLLFPLGAVAAPANKEENERSDQLHWRLLSLLILLGPAVNVFLLMAGKWLQNLGGPAAGIGSRLAYYNSLLAYSNLLPLWQLDAGLLFLGVLVSLQLRKRMLRVMIILTDIIIIQLILIAFAGNPEDWKDAVMSLMEYKLWTGFLAVSLAGMWWKYLKGKPPAVAKEEQLMSDKQVMLFFALYNGLIFAMLSYMEGLPHWLWPFG